VLTVKKMIAENIKISSSNLTLMTIDGEELADHGGLEDLPVVDGSTIQVAFNDSLINSQGTKFERANKELLKALTTTSPSSSSSSHRPSPTPRLAEQAVVDAVSAHRLAQQALENAQQALAKAEVAEETADATLTEAVSEALAEKVAAEQAVDEAEAALATSGCRTVTNGYE